MVDRRKPTKLVHSAVGVVVFFVALAGLGSVFAADQATGAATRRREEPTVPRAAYIPIDAALVSRARAKAEEQFRQAQELQVAQYLAAVAEYYRPKTGVNWDGIARCETGGNWSMQGPRYSGGVGFYNGTWNGFGGREFAPNAGMASKPEQIIVAERVYARHRLTGWGCRAYG